MNTGYEHLSDEVLLEKLKKGEHQIMDYIMEKYKYLVRKNAKAMFLIGGDSDDLLQEGMIGLFKAVRDFDASKESSFVTFANLCINRQLYTAVRASNRKKHLPLNTYISLYSEEGDSNLNLIEQVRSAQNENPENKWIAQESLETIYKHILSDLSKFEKEVLEYYLDDMNYNQIAEKVGKPEKSIDNALQRIRHKISYMLEQRK